MRLYTSKEIQNIVLNKWGIEDNIYYQVSSSNPNTYDLVYKGLKNGGLILLNKADLIAFRETELNPNPLAQQAIEENTKLADSKVSEIQEGTAISVDNSTPTKPKVSFSGNLITDNEKAALDAANSPSGTNPFATIDDLPTGGGTVTSVDLSMPSAFNVSGNPITTSGTIAVSGSGTTSEYIRGDGTLDTFPTIPSISGLVPYIGATTDVDLGTFSLNAKSLHIKGTGGAGHLGLKHQSANITANTNESSLGADSSGNPQWKNDGNTVDSLELQSNKSSSYTASSTTTYANTKALVDGLATKVTTNVAITGATKTKITYDSKGLVTSGADATTADITDSTNKRYVTDAQLVVIGNTSGVNTGDQILTGTYKALHLSTNLTGGSTYFLGSLSVGASTTAANRRVVLGFAHTITAVSGFISSTSASGNNTLYIRVNNTTDYLVSNTFNINANQFSFNITGLSIAIGASDYWEFKLVMGVSVSAAVAEYNARYTL